MKTNNDEEVTSTKEDRTKEISLSKFTPSVSSSKSRSVSSAGDFSVVNAKGNSKRIVISKRILDLLDTPSTLQFSFSKRSLIFGYLLEQNYSNFIIKYSGTKGIIYSSQLVNEITEKYDLDFKNRTMITFPKGKIREVDERPVALVTILPKEE